MFFRCCGSEWNRPETKQVCKKCGKEVLAKEFEEWEKRWFGHFQCLTKEIGWDRKPCGRSWKSSWTWTIDNQIQPTKCKTCEASIMPYKLVSSQRIRLKLTVYLGRNRTKRYRRRGKKRNPIFHTCAQDALN